MSFTEADRAAGRALYNYDKIRIQKSPDMFGVTLGAIAGGIAVDVIGTSAPLYVTATCAVLAAMLMQLKGPPALIPDGRFGVGRPSERRCRTRMSSALRETKRETIMVGKKVDHPAPETVDRETFQATVDALRVREKAHTREGDAVAAARRRLPMVKVDGATPLKGENGSVTLLDAFEGRQMLIALLITCGSTAGRQPSNVRGAPSFLRRRCAKLSHIHSRDIHLTPHFLPGVI